MNKYLVILLLTATSFLFIVCKDKPTSNSSDPANYHTSACISSALEKSTAGMSSDSIFSYNFTSSGLNLDFSVVASCGREENAFVVNHTVHDDTIDVGVADTCLTQAKCMCTYMVTISDIPAAQDRYIVRCNFVNSINSHGYLVHLVEVHR